MIHSLVNGICLISVGHDCFISKYAYRCINDQAWIYQLGRIKGLCTDSLSVLYKHTVAAVLASSHDKIRGNCLGSVSGATDYDSSSRIRILFQFFVKCYHFHADVLLSRLERIILWYKKTPGKPFFQAAQAVGTNSALHSLWVFPRSASHAVLFYTTIFPKVFQDGKNFIYAAIFL